MSTDQYKWYPVYTNPRAEKKAHQQLLQKGIESYLPLTRTLKQWSDIGLLPLIYAHLFSLDLMRVIFAKQTMQGKGPGAAASAAA